MTDLIERAAAIDALSWCNEWYVLDFTVVDKDDAIHQIKALPSAKPEPLTDEEKRIFLAAMAREEKVCEEVDRNYMREPYKDSLMSVCKSIKRKVKDALWGT